MTVKPVPEIIAWVTLTMAFPVLVTVRLCMALLPTETLPKLRLMEVAERVPVVGGGG